MFYNIRPLTDLLTRHTRQTLRPCHREKRNQIIASRINKLRLKALRKAIAHDIVSHGKKDSGFVKIHICRSFPCPGVVAPTKGENQWLSGQLSFWEEIELLVRDHLAMRSLWHARTSTTRCWWWSYKSDSVDRWQQAEQGCTILSRIRQQEHILSIEMHI